MSATTFITPRTARRRSTFRRAATAIASLAMAIGARWDDIVDSAQLGPTHDQPESRHLGGRI
ncbi:MAG: hypothetical protein K5924_09070 [Chloroflexi bacterium]|nr:hypothetical protein [Chloroflexota bacterium]